MTAHLIHGSPLRTVRREPQATRDDAVRGSVETCRGETVFDVQQRAVLAALGVDPERTTVLDSSGDDFILVRLFLRLLDQSDTVVLDALAVAMGVRRCRPEVLRRSGRYDARDRYGRVAAKRELDDQRADPAAHSPSPDPKAITPAAFAA